MGARDEAAAAKYAGRVGRAGAAPPPGRWRPRRGELNADRNTRAGGLAVEPPADKGAVQLKGLKLFKVVARGGEWAVDREGRQRALSVHTTKAEATERARALAHSQLPSRLEVYKEDGTLQETFTYPQ
jgi:hypothetical protein